MMAAAVRRFGSIALPGVLRRGAMAGTAWGVSTGLIVIASGAWDCGFVCLPDAALTMGVSVVAGLATIGPLAVFRKWESLPFGRRALSERS